MRASEVLAFLPLLIYGIAIAALFSQWKRFINYKNIYIPYALFTILLTEIALYNVYLFSQLVGEINMMDYKSYLIYILPPFIFLIAVNIFTPEKDDETETYFKENMSVFFILIAFFVASHFLFNYEETSGMFFARIIIIIWLLLTGILRRIWMVYVFVAIWLLLLMSRLSLISY
jgi:hypothetical protein